MQNKKMKNNSINFLSVWFNGVRISYTVGVSLCFLALVLDYMFFLMSRFQTVLWFNAIITIIINISSKWILFSNNFDTGGNTLIDNFLKLLTVLVAITILKIFQ